MFENPPLSSTLSFSTGLRKKKTKPDIWPHSKFSYYCWQKKKPLDNIKNIEHSICDKARGKKQGQISKDRMNLQSQIRYSSVLGAVLGVLEN